MKGLFKKTPKQRGNDMYICYVVISRAWDEGTL